ncbi:aldose epimerase family protein [Salisediminibacterium beveridgei]|uniref:Uncharacterized protein n=1 Tax=Salisediminibacterium beveridgei TaxID=632773 RepID=A0A1D7QTA3_9BACI|nr:hypothetical protein [Salisediminibacterium beveridgei]AOM82219.1 hypothetical protein BBEV_0848 [Salisediminibacterium beveridgei]
MYLENERLKVEIQTPGSFYNGPRFDWTGFISQITLDDAVRYCVPERLEEGKGTGGHGLCNEFGLDKPIGYDEIEVGELFPKIGTGLLKKDQNEAYDIFHPYPVTPAKINAEEKEDALIFDVSDASPDGYGYHLNKAITLEDNRLIISYKLTNTGTKPISTNEYSHNFIGINDRELSEGYQLTIPGLKNIDVVVGSILKTGDRITFPVTPDDDVYAGIEWSAHTGSYNWDVYHTEVGAGVRERSVFEPAKMALWGHTHVVCPEVFIDIELAVNETKSWQRVYEFYQKTEG